MSSSARPREEAFHSLLESRIDELRFTCESWSLICAEQSVINQAEIRQ